MDIATMQRVEHNYHDHSNEISEAAAGQDDQHRVFPVQLHHVLAHLEREGLARKWCFNCPPCHDVAQNTYRLNYLLR